jgi:hypothetical protein
MGGASRSLRASGSTQRQSRGGLRVARLFSGSPAAALRQPFPTKALGKGLCVSRLFKAEHHNVAVVAPYGVRERRRR